MKRLPAEWEAQSFIQLVFPPIQSDWSDYFDEVCAYYEKLIKIIKQYEEVLLVVENETLEKRFGALCQTVLCKTNDTWARDVSVLTIEEEGSTKLLNFHFNGWGGKFDATLDNQMSQYIAHKYSSPMEDIDFILEGGAIESNGEDIILATKEAVLNPNRQNIDEKECEALFALWFGTKKVLWLDNGYLAGDDTDSHVDTLARFITKDTIAYVKCEDKEDEHYEALMKMEEELKNLKDCNGNPFTLVSLPHVKAKYYEEERLPATYANFLFVNGALLVPTYNDDFDTIALQTLQEALPNIDVVGVESSILIRQHGSLHCISMQFPKGVKLV